MNSRERMARAMLHRIPDRVPVMCQLALGHYFLNTNLPPHRIWFTSEGFAEALVTLQQRYRFDGILINIPGRPANVLDDVISIETTLDGERLTWRDDGVTFIPHDENPQHFSTTQPDRADFEAIDPDHLDCLDDFQGYVWNTYHIPRLAGKPTRGVLNEIPDYFFRTIDLVKRAVGDAVSIHGEVFSPFTHYMELFGYEPALMSLLADPGKARALLDRLTDASIAWAVAQARRGVDAVLISSAFAGGSLISTAMYREFVLPYERRVVEAVNTTSLLTPRPPLPSPDELHQERGEGVQGEWGEATPVYTHTCGRIGDRLELIAETGTQGIDTLDPPPLGNVELAEAKRIIGDRLFIKGNLDSVALLAYQTKEQVIADTSARIRVGKPGGGYILSTACSVSPHVEPWKLELLVPLAEELGDY